MKGDKENGDGGEGRNYDLPVTLNMDAEFPDGKCPFRGHPNRCYRDSRCPTEIRCYLVEGAQALPGKGMSFFAVPRPILTEGGDCWACIYDLVREREAGKDFKPRSSYDGDGGGELKRRRRKRGSGVSRKEARDSLANAITEQDRKE